MVIVTGFQRSTNHDGSGFLENLAGEKFNLSNTGCVRNQGCVMVEQDSGDGILDV